VFPIWLLHILPLRVVVLLVMLPEYVSADARTSICTYGGRGGVDHDLVRCWRNRMVGVFRHVGSNPTLSVELDAPYERAGDRPRKRYPFKQTLDLRAKAVLQVLLLPGQPTLKRYPHRRLTGAAFDTRMEVPPIRRSVS
jgi:hypothetical protein